MFRKSRDIAKKNVAHNLKKIGNAVSTYVVQAEAQITVGRIATLSAGFTWFARIAFRLPFTENRIL